MVMRTCGCECVVRHPKLTTEAREPGANGRAVGAAPTEAVSNPES
eukprot:SAG11_NODE_2884_length_2870_cov_1.601949_1_plen_44_part_10